MSDDASKSCDTDLGERDAPRLLWPSFRPSGEEASAAPSVGCRDPKCDIQCHGH